MAKRKTNFKIGNNKSKQKSISFNLEKSMKRFQRHLQKKQNVKHGRKAATISFLYATSKPMEFARFLVREDK